MSEEMKAPEVNAQPTTINPPLPPPPNTEIKPENIGKILTDQYTQSINYHRQITEIKSEYDKFKAQFEETTKVNAEKLSSYDNIKARADKLNEFAAGILKSKYEGLDKEFLEAYGSKLVLEELLKDPLNGIAQIDENLTIFNAMVEKFKALQDDGTKGKPANQAAEQIQLTDRTDYIRAARDYHKNKAGL